MSDLNQTPLGLTVKAEEDVFLDPEGRLVRAKAGSTLMFKIAASTKLKKLKRVWCQKVGVLPDAVIFTFGGRTVEDTHSAGDLFMIDQDVIFVKHTPAFLSRVSQLPSSRVADFARLLDEPEHADVVLVVGKNHQRMSAVKAILAVRSGKFRGMFSKNFVEGGQAEIVLENVQPQIMWHLLKYLYTDQVDMPEDADDIAALLMLAEEYIVPHLKRECEVALLTQVRERNVCTLLHTADMYSAPLLKEVCKQFLLDNFSAKPHLGEELKNSPGLLLEITKMAVDGNKRRRLA